MIIPKLSKKNSFNPSFGGIHSQLKRVAVHCAYCGKTMDKITIDHIIPKSKGGQDNILNYVASCEHCNSSRKGDLYLGQLIKTDKSIIQHLKDYFKELNGKIIDGINYSEIVGKKVLDTII